MDNVISKIMSFAQPQVNKQAPPQGVNVSNYPGYQPSTPQPQQFDMQQFGKILNSIGSGIGGGINHILHPMVSPVSGNGPIGQNVPTFDQQAAAKGWSKGADGVYRMNLTPSSPAATPMASPVGMAVAARQAMAPAVQKAVQGSLGRSPDVYNHPKPLTPQVQQAIAAAASKYGIPASLLYDIGYYEGGYRPDAANNSPEGQAVGTPVGVFQFTPGTWNHDLYNYARQPGSTLTDWLVNGQVPDRADPQANAQAAAYLIKNGQLNRWDASKNRWGEYYSPEELQSYYAQAPAWHPLAASR